MKGVCLNRKLGHLILTDTRACFAPVADIKMIGEKREFRKVGKRFSEI